MSDRLVLAIDPGSSKCGLAVVQRKDDEIELLYREICAKDNLEEAIWRILNEHQFTMIIVGAGTRSRDTIAKIREIMPSVAILQVDEKDTTLQARERYWEHHKRKGWRRLLPATLQVPPDPVDDFAAMILAERVLSPG